MHVSKRLTAVLLTLLMTAGALWGSTQEISPLSQELEQEMWSSRKETMYIWYADEALSSYINAAAVRFGDAENVRVIPVLKDPSDFMEEINAATMDPETQLPDAYIINNDELEKAYLAGLACEIREGKDMVSRQFCDTAVAAVSYKGKMVAYPFYYDTSVLVYNKDYVDMWLQQQRERVPEEEEPLDEEIPEAQLPEEEQPQEDGEELVLEDIIGEDGIPLTVDGLLYFADTFDAPEGVDGVMKWAVSDIFYNYWIVGAYLNVGGDSGDDKSNIDMNNQQVIDCLEVYQGLNQFFYIEPDTASYESTIQEFLAGKMVFTIGTSELLERLETAKENGTFICEYGVAQLPDVSTKLDSRALSVTHAVAVNGYSAHKDLANGFARYLTKDRAFELYRLTNKLPASPEAYGGDAMREIFLKQYSSSVSLPKMMEIGNLWLWLESLFSKVWNGEEVSPLVEELENQIFTQIR